MNNEKIKQNRAPICEALQTFRQMRVVSVIHAAEMLAAEAFGVAHAFLMVGGTTSFKQKK